GKPQTAAEFTTPWRATGGLQIGRLYYKGEFQEYTDGTIDNIRIWDRSVVIGCADTAALGHRGAPELAPENTLESLTGAAEHGVDWVETDVQFTKDGQPVIMHDDTVDRTTDGTGRVDELTAAEIAQLTVDGGGKVPTLDQALLALQPFSSRLLLEIKGPQSAAAVDKALGLVSEHGMTERTTLQSFDESVIEDAARSPHRTELALVRSTLDTDPVATAQTLGLDAYVVKSTALSSRPAVVTALKQAGVSVFTWTVNSESEWTNVTSWDVDGVITDRSVQFLQWRASHCAS
ncbi:glycerophosphodiester phosphodiesterase family protein, partial [Streptomyces sp. CC224E]|uniref:glycerophosphodiester phosphodiesterase n=2 Tax=unclassified Streptomyces TaxID=2593676 RepID=UPI00278C7A23